MVRLGLLSHAMVREKSYPLAEGQQGECFLWRHVCFFRGTLKVISGKDRTCHHQLGSGRGYLALTGSFFDRNLSTKLARSANLPTEQQHRNYPYTYDR